jgi:hypothetical protein
MTTTINASTSAGLVQTADTSGSLALQTAGTTAVTVDTSQNVGIGTSSIASGGKLEVNGFISSSSSGKFLNYGWSGSNAYIQTTDASSTGYNLVFYGGASERMRIGSDGRLFVNSTSTASYFDGKINCYGDAAVPALCLKNDGTGGQFTASFWNVLTSGNNIFANFLTETSPTIRGSIQYNRSGGLVVYNTTSDYRAKTVNGSVQNALAKVALLKPSTGRMNGATEDIDFFVAHELQEVVPSAVTGEKDAVNEDSTPKYQMVDKSALIPLLTKAIQELKQINDTQAETLSQQATLINALTARIEALENK